MSLERVDRHARSVIWPLRMHGHHDTVRLIERILADAADPSRSEDALNDLIGLCHIRALGDLNVPSLTWSDWLRRLETLERACKTELRRQGKEDRESRRRREETEARKRRRATAGSKEPPGGDPRPAQSDEDAGSASDADGGGDGPDPTAAFATGAAALLVLVALYAGLMILAVTPDFRPPAIATVVGVFERSEISAVSLHARRLGRATRTIFLKDDAIAYRLPDPHGGGQHAAARLMKGDVVTMLVDRDEHSSARATQELLQARLEGRSGLDAFGSLAARSVFEGRRNPVAVLEIRKGDDVILSRLRLLPEARRSLVVWAGVATGALFTLFGLLVHDRRRRGPPPPRAASAAVRGDAA